VALVAVEALEVASAAALAAARLVVAAQALAGRMKVKHLTI
jgi:hypothetical protein